MLMHEAMQVINDEPKPMGYMISFDRTDGRFLTSDHFPDKHRGEPLIPTEEEAWVLAQKFAAKTVGRCVNLCVVAHDFEPVPGYKTRKIENRT